MIINIREAETRDFDRLEEILIQNEMLNCPDIDGKEAMSRIKERTGRYFLVAVCEEEDKVIGLIRGCYDGSRALIHQMAVDKNYQNRGVGKKLMNQIALRLNDDGALSLSVTCTEKSQRYYERLEFNDYSVKLFVASDINHVTEKTKL